MVTIYEPDQSHLSLGVLVGISGSALLFLILFIVFSSMYQEKLRREGNTTCIMDFILFSIGI